MKEALKYSPTILAFVVGIELATGNKDNGINYRDIFLATFLYLIQYAMLSSFNSSMKNTSKEAISELSKLVILLKSLGIDIDLKTLLNAKEDKVEYIFVREDAKVILRENKYILLPTCDAFGGQKEITLLQEHDFGSRNYVLSIGSPKKLVKRVRAYE